MISTVAFGPNIISPNESILYIDAANPISYPGSGNSWSDLTRYRHNGTLINGPTYNSSNGGSIVFDGVNDYIDFTSTVLSAPFRSLLGTSFTINAWVKATADNGTIAAFRNYSLPARYNVIFQMNNLAGQFYFLFGDSDQNPSYAIATTPYSLNTWYNVVGVRNNNICHIYLNGIYKNSSSTLSVTHTGDPSLSVGTLLNGTYLFNGNIANVDIYNRVLSNDEILQNYNAVRNRFGV